MARWLASKHWLFGSSDTDSVPFDKKVAACNSIETFLAEARHRSRQGSVDLIEIF